MSLTPEVRAQYIEIIDSVLAKSDLTTVSTKVVRNRLQEAVGHDLTPHKATIKALIIERFNIFAVRDGIEAPPEEAAGPANGATTVEDSVARSSPHQSSSPQKRPADNEEVADEPIKSPPPKKRKADNDVDADALLAARLQAEENARARPTRGASTRRAAPIKKKKSKSKTTKRVKAEDDSDLESEPEETTKREVNRSGGFHKPLNLSPALSALLGEVSTVKKVWEYIRTHDLQDPSDKRQIRCDDAMRAVFKQDRVHMFTMTKIISQNLYSTDE